MAKRRMLSIPILETDKFYSLSTSSQALYLHLNLNADDDGVVDKLKSVMRMMHIDPKAYRALISNGYILELGEGLVVITHWHLHNRIKKDRYVAGEYQEQLSTLTQDEGSRYIKASEDISGDICAPQDRIVKDRLVKDSTDKGSIAKHRAEKEEEKKNNSLFLTDIHSKPASQEADKNVNSSFPPDSLTISALKNNIKLYFMKHFQTVDTFGFIEHYEAKNWQTDEGESIIGNFREYIEEWMKHKI